MKSAENPIGSVMISALEAFKREGRLYEFITPEIHSIIEISADVKTNFELLPKDKKISRIRNLLKEELGVTVFHNIKTRKREYVHYRQLFAYFLKRRMGLKWRQMSYYTHKSYENNRYSVRTIEREMEWNKELAEKVNRINDLL